MRPTRTSKTLQLKTKFYAAGIVLDANGICRESAPIVKWMIGKGEKWIRHHCEKHNIEVLDLGEQDHEQTDTDYT